MNQEIDALLGKLDAHPGSLLFARLADAYMRTDKMDRAIEVCEQGLSHHAHYVSGHMVMAKCYRTVGLLDQAKVEYSRVFGLDREHAAAHFRLGDIYYEEKKFDMALEAYERVLEIDPSNEPAQKRIAQLKGPRADRTPELDFGLESAGDKEAPEDAIATPTLAEIYASQGLIDRAIGVLRHLLERSPDRDEVLKRIHELENELQTRHTGGDHGHDG